MKLHDPTIEVEKAHLAFNSAATKHPTALEKPCQCTGRRLQHIRHKLDLEHIEGKLGLTDILLANWQTSAVDAHQRCVLENSIRLRVVSTLCMVSQGTSGKLGLFESHVHGSTIFS